MRSSAKHGAPDNNRGISGHVLTLRQRLYRALNLGSWENREKWNCSDIEVQRLVLRSIDAFVECISSETLQYPLVKLANHSIKVHDGAPEMSTYAVIAYVTICVVHSTRISNTPREYLNTNAQDSVIDLIRALKSILDFKSHSILRQASMITVKMVNTLPSSTLQLRVMDLICPLANLLSSQQLQVAMSCATAMDIILSKLSSRQEKEVGRILKEREAVDCVVRNFKQFRINETPFGYYQEMASLLSKILWRWPSFRFCVWNDSKFLVILDAARLMSEDSVTVAVLQLYSSIALCGNGAEKLLENGEALLKMMVRCMDSSNTNSVRIEAFKLARCLSLSKKGCTRMMNICCEPLVKAMTNALDNWRSQSEKFAKSQLSVLEEACCLASVTRWAGDHHIYFWKSGVDRLLLDLLLENYSKIHQQQHELSLNDLIIIVRESRDSNLLHPFRPYVWDILGGLVSNCAEYINHKMHKNELQLNALIICACFSFIDSVGTLRQVSQKGLVNISECEAASRAVLMMVYSPCKYIASLARSILCEILKSDDKDYVEYFLDILTAVLTGNKFCLPGNLQIVVSLMGLACYCSQQKYCDVIVKLQGMKTVVAFITWCLNNPVRIKRADVVPHLRDSCNERSCCIPCTEEWEGEDIVLLFSLWILAELLHHIKLTSSDNQYDFSEAELIRKLEGICRDQTSHGSRWYAAYALSYFGLFGFPSKLGKRIGKSLDKEEHSDQKLVLINEESVYVHEVILTVRCQSLLPPWKSVPEEDSSNGPSTKLDMGRNIIKAVHLSAHVDQQSLWKILEYIYSGYLQANESLVKKLKIFARHCKLESLVEMLSKRNPRWGVPIPSFDLSPALRPAGHNFSDLVFEASSMVELVNWKCSSCSSLVPHLHVHKVIVESSCDYLRALFQSGMQESLLQTIKVPTSWDSLNKLVTWFYSDQLPVPSFDCVWHNSDPEGKYREIQTYIELCWIAEFWLIEDLREECYQIAICCLESSKHLSAKVIHTAANFSQWGLAQVAANYMAPSYNLLRNSGELDVLDSNVVEMVRAASVRLSQEASRHSS